MKLEINNRRKPGKITNTWKVNNTLMNNKWIKEEIKGKIKELFETKMATKHTKTCGIQ